MKEKENIQTEEEKVEKQVEVETEDVAEEQVDADAVEILEDDVEIETDAVAEEEVGNKKKIKVPKNLKENLQNVFGTIFLGIDKLLEAVVKLCPSKLTKKRVAAIFVILIILLMVVFSSSSFSSVQKKVENVTGSTVFSSGNDYFTVDTNPYNWDYDDLEYSQMILFSKYQEYAIDGIKLANVEFGFGDSLYNSMMSTTSLMGRQTEENSSVKVSWYYHPNKGLEVTYTKK